MPNFKCGHSKTVENIYMSSSHGGRYQYPACKACHQARNRRDRRNHPERDKNYREKNKDRMTLYNKAYYQENGEAIKERMRVQYEEDPEKFRKRVSAWRKDHPDLTSEWTRQYKLKKKAVESEDFGGLWGLFERDGGLCAYCGRECVLEGPTTPRKATVEHIVPISLGGPDVGSNVVLACQSCNSKKGNRLLEEKA